MSGALGATTLTSPSTSSSSRPRAAHQAADPGMSSLLSRCGSAVRHGAARFLQAPPPATSQTRLFAFGRASTPSKAKVAREAREARDEAIADPSLDAKARALDQALKEINSRFGKNSIMKLGAQHFGEVQTSPSGALTLDLALGGGYPKGRVVEIYGPESSGKTTLALHAMAEVQQRGGYVALIDAEHAFDPIFAKKIGLDVEGLYMCQPDSGEMGLEVADQLIRSSAVDMIAIDSVAALVPRSEIEGEIGQLQVGAQARLMSAALRKIAGNASKHGCTVIFLNQLRQKVGVIYGSPEVTSGGQALKYYASVRLEVRIKEKIAGADGQVGIRVKAKCTKNKVAPPYRLAEFDIMFGSGISAAGCLLDAAEAVEVVSRRGSWYYHGEARLAQGRDKTLEVLREDDALRSKIEVETRHVLGGKNINELYADDDAAAEASGAEDEGAEGASSADEEEEAAPAP